MPAQTDSGVQSRAVIVAADESLRLSLIFLLQMCGLDAVALTDFDELLGSCRLDEQFIFADCSISGCVSEIERLRYRGWEGTAVLMAESELAGAYNRPSGPVRVLVKPFSSEDVLAIFTDQSAPTHAY